MVVPVDFTGFLQPAGGAEPEPELEPGAEFEPWAEPEGAARRAGFVALMHNVSWGRAESSPVGIWEKVSRSALCSEKK